jgi:two-component system, OmpR family, sensor histidine kinase KdpD
MRTLSQPQTELVELIDQQSTHLNSMTNRFLRMTQLESESLRLKREPVLLPPLIDEIMGECSGQLYGHPIQVHLADTDLTVPADRQLLAMTITELLVNAAKYSGAHSPINLSARRQNDEIVVAVHNNGPVIAVQERELIFERFYRSPASKRSAPGSGIGLAIAKKTATAHYGRVWVNSEQETGTTFFLSLPALERRVYEYIAN